MSRTFNAKQKQALLKDSGGYCRLCGVPLLAGWHADHIIPYSKGGETDVINGQALCAACNLKKGNKMIQLREWQKDALVNIRERFLGGQQSCLVHCTPGGGKTIFALSMFDDMRKRTCDKIVVVVPSVNLVNQWMNEAVNTYGIELKNGMLYSSCSDFEEFDGIITTYQALNSNRQDLRIFCERNNVLVVADEAHHVADNQKWGDYFKESFELSKNILSLTGTPWTSSQGAIPFVKYGPDGLVEADAVYSKIKAIEDGVCRITEFYAFDPPQLVTDTRTGLQTEYASIEQAENEGIGAYANSTKSCNQMYKMFKEADKQLGDLRSRTVRSAGGLIVAPDIKTAHEFKDKIHLETGVKYVVVSSEDLKSHEKIKAFKNSNDRWLISINMVSEGIDIKRLQVCLFLSFAKTELFLRQVVGRIERVRVDDNLGKVDSTGYFYYLNHPEIDRIVKLIEDDNKRGKELLEEKDHNEPTSDSDGEISNDLVDRVPRYLIEQMEHELEKMIARGEIYDDEIMKDAMLLKATSRHYRHFSLSDMCNIVLATMDEGGENKTVEDDAPDLLPLSERKANVRQLMSDEVRRKVGAAKLLQQYQGSEVSKLFKAINYHLNKKVGIRSLDDDISLDQLQRRLDYVYATEPSTWLS